MNRYRFLLSPTWIGWFALCTLFAVACVFLGQWQIDRREASLEEINRIVANYDEDPVPYAEARELFDSAEAEDEWTVVELTGEYRQEDSLLVRNRAHRGSVGYEVLVPFAVAGTEEVVIIDRGWLPTDSTDGSRPESRPAPPEGQVDVIVRIRPAEPAINREAPEGQLASIDLAQYQDELGYGLLTGGYGLMAEESPAPETAPRQLTRPSLEEGPHLSYSMQWITFGLLGFIGWGYAARIHARNRDFDEAEAAMTEEAPQATTDDGGPVHAASSAPAQDRAREASRRHRLRTGRLSDEDLEDAWVDQQLHR
ncbi:SURF1 family protein [Nesterenkonia lutea]|uniref:SURF1-like protein n=1 Tax=Nesterenkonia lutea TaxID=272919 RepID=A0ABR9JCW1_9MICC|nr:SURF1 family protein [Nesterenkonia lutea]MBE1523769.1 cytochrome oxidase assembly protein ShyY1 [Nesterenkonia lutea]